MDASLSIPEMLLPWLKPEAAKHLRCSQVSENEFRVEIMDALPADVLGPVAMLGYARRFHEGSVPCTDEVMRELRSGDAD
jgi:hypothetical protein